MMKVATNNNESLDSSESNKRKRLLKQKQITLVKDTIEGYTTTS